jgi:exodeoxyribonuclease V alpha subunit
VTDPFDARGALGAPESLRPFNAAGVLEAADVHVALRLAALAGTEEPAAVLAAALAVRAPRLGHVYVDLATVRTTAVADTEELADPAALPWPHEDWVGRLAATGLAAVGEADEEHRPLRLVGTRLYLDRYWREERRLAADLRTFIDADPATVDEPALAGGLARLFDDELPRQEPAARLAVAGPSTPPARDAEPRLADAL